MAPKAYTPRFSRAATVSWQNTSQIDVLPDEPLCSSSSNISPRSDGYLFPLAPSRTSLVQFAPEHSLVRVHETWSQEEYDRSPCFTRRPDRLSPIEDSDNDIGDTSGPHVTKADATPPFTPTTAKLYRGTGFGAEIDADEDAATKDVFSSAFARRSAPQMDNVAAHAARLLAALQSNDFESVDRCK
jgi:hypothetical protein